MGATASSDGAPRWAVVAAWTILVSLTPSAIWRTAVGLGVDLGWSEEQLERQQIPGSGTVYVVVLSVLSLLAGAAALRLVRPGGDRVPGWVPGVGGRRPPAGVVVGCGLLGAVLVAWICAMSVRKWDQVSGFADQPDSGWSLLMVACYAPALLWSPLLVAVTVDHGRRRRTRC